MERLQKYLAAAGVASRRKSELLIRQGRVTVNGKRAEIGTKVCPQQDIIRVDGRVVVKEKKAYIILYKPAGVITTRRDPRGRTTVMDLLEGVTAQVHPVGRLDFDTAGLLLLTNDGDLTYRLTHPSHGVEKTYHALVKGKISNQDIGSLRRGILLEDGWSAPALVQVLGYQKDATQLELTIHEGRNRQVRRMCAALGYPVLKLMRVRFGFLTLGRLQPGEFRYLSRDEVVKLRALGHFQG